MSKDVLVTRFRVRIPVREHVPTDNRRGTRSRITGYREGVAEVTYNLNELRSLAEKAGRNKTLKARSGPCDARVTFDKNSPVTPA